MGPLFLLGEFWGGVGLSWLVWGMFVRTTLLYHATWLVNSATHSWGYRNYATRDASTNLWWVALLSLGEGWHNNHHAFPRSARHGLRWWEVDLTYCLIRLLSLVYLVRQIQVPAKALCRQMALDRPLAERFPRRCVADEECGPASSGLVSSDHFQQGPSL
jgi:stearoyl-CoA desaturase (delta-9 desaturase)